MSNPVDTLPKKPGRGGKRSGSGRKHEPDGRTQVLSVRVEPDIAEWLRLNGGSKLHYKILRRAIIESQII